MIAHLVNYGQTIRDTPEMMRAYYRLAYEHRCVINDDKEPPTAYDGSDYDWEPFDELFGPMLTGRCYTWRQTLHAKNVVESERELFISFGYDNELFGHEDARLNIPLPPNAGSRS